MGIYQWPTVPPLVVPQMSLPPSLSPISRLLYSLSAAASQLRASARGVAFWTAIALPFGYLPLFTFETVPVSIELFVLLLVVNAVALIIGHSYHR